VKLTVSDKIKESCLGVWRQAHVVCTFTPVSSLVYVSYSVQETLFAVLFNNIILNQFPSTIQFMLLGNTLVSLCYLFPCIDNNICD
jgi:hypothetical protein